MALDYTTEYLLLAIKCAIDDTPLPKPREGFDFEQLLKLSCYHNVGNIAAYPLERADFDVPDDIMKKFLILRDRAVRDCALRDIAIAKLSDMLEQNAIAHVALKGAIMKDYYPMPDMRTSCDIDMLYDDKFYSVIDSYLEKIGYKFHNFSDGERTYFAKPMPTVEMHSSLFYSAHGAYAIKYKNDFEIMKLREGTKYTYDMPLEDVYLYMVAHIAKHFVYDGGSGIRSILDFYVFDKYCRKNLDEDYIERKLAESKLTRFEREMSRLSMCMFGKKPYDSYTEKLCEYVSNSGVFGDFKSKTALMMADSKSLGAKKAGMFLRNVFPKMKKMKRTYPVLVKAPYLAPVFYIYRLFDFTFSKKHKTVVRGVLDTYGKIDKKFTREVTSIYNGLGLDINKK